MSTTGTRDTERITHERRAGAALAIAVARINAEAGSRIKSVPVEDIELDVAA